MAKDKASKVVYIDELVSDEEAAREVRSTYREETPARIRSENGDPRKDRPSCLDSMMSAILLVIFFVGLFV